MFKSRCWNLPAMILEALCIELYTQILALPAETKNNILAFFTSKALNVEFDVCLRNFASSCETANLKEL